jgi:hypothetical protein
MTATTVRANARSLPETTNVDRRKIEAILRLLEQEEGQAGSEQDNGQLPVATYPAERQAARRQLAAELRQSLGAKRFVRQAKRDGSKHQGA